MSQTVSVPGVGDLDFPDGMSQSDMASAIKKNFPDIHPNPRQARKDAAVTRTTPPAPKGPARETVDDVMGSEFVPAAQRTAARLAHQHPTGDETTGISGGIGENLLAAGSTVVGGLAGLGRTAGGMVAGEDFSKAAGAGADVSRALTYEPTSRAGKDIATLLTEPIRVAGEQVVGPIAENAATSMARSVNASPQTVGQVGSAARTAGEAAIPLTMAAKPLGEATKRLTTERTDFPPIPGEDFSPLRQLPPEQEARYQRLKKGGYEPTLGQVTREPAQFAYEDLTKRREGGGDLLDRKAEQNAQLAKNVEKNYPPQTTTLPDSKVGGLVRGVAEAKLQAKKAEVRGLYKRAERLGEMADKVDVTPLLQYFAENIDDIESGAIPQLGAIRGAANRMIPKPKAPPEPPPAILDQYGKPLREPVVEPPEPPQLSLGQLEALYRRAGRLSKPADPPSLKAMGDVKKLINEITEGKGGENYRAARKARLEQGMEFEEQGGVARLVEKASKTDYKTDASKLWPNIVNGTVEDLRQTLKTLVRDVRPGVTTTARTDAIAVRALQRKTMEHVLEEATKSATKDKLGNPEFSPAVFKKSLDTIGREKLDLLWGKAATDQMYKLVDNAIELKTQPDRVAGSPTVSNAQILTDKVFTNRAAFALEHLASKLGIPGVPGAIRWAREQIAAHADKAFTKAQVAEALTPTKASPGAVSEMAKPVRKQIRQIRMAEGRETLKAPAAVALTMDKRPPQEPEKRKHKTYSKAEAS